MTVPVQTPGIPRVAVGTICRCGSSMFMRMLEAGGLTIDHTPEPDAPLLNIFRNPGGFYENHPNLMRELYANSFKFNNPDRVSRIPTDYKLLLMLRPIAEIAASLNDVQAAYVDAYAAAGQTFDDPAIIPNMLNFARDMEAKWQAIKPALTGVPMLDYDSVCADPLKAMLTVAGYINTPSFQFDARAAAAIVDPAHYINRAA